MSHKDKTNDYYLWDNLTKSCDGNSEVFQPPSVAEFVALLRETEKAQASQKILASVAPKGPVSPPSYTDKLLGPAKKAVQDFDAKTYKQLSKSRIKINRKLDLHGAQQDQAHALLLNFLISASRDNLRYVIVITGKGAKNGGILQNMVPKWLRWGEAAQYVGAFATAGAKHGANGALYIRLRSSKPKRGLYPVD